MLIYTYFFAVRVGVTVTGFPTEGHIDQPSVTEEYFATPKDIFEEFFVDRGNQNHVCN